MQDEEKETEEGRRQKNADAGKKSVKKLEL
jgi:hypothetical protein